MIYAQNWPSFLKETKFSICLHDKARFHKICPNNLAETTTNLAPQTFFGTLEKPNTPFVSFTEMVSNKSIRQGGQPGWTAPWEK